jgi:LysR family transcriptional regulator, glycine cleavage system transcriptional activator
MPIPIPPLPPLRLFEAAARHESFTKAADELGLTASAVSHGIDSLEKWLGVELFQRRPRGVTLTPAGHHLLPYVSEALAMVALGVQRMPGRKGERRVVLSVAPTFAQRFLVPRLPRFRTLHPGIRLAIDTSHRQALFPMEGVDLSIRMGRGAWPGVKSDLLFREQLVPVATAAYLESVRRDGAINWPKVTFLRVSSLENDWTAWIEGAGAQIEIAEDLLFDTVALATEAAATGMGIAIGRAPLISPDLAAGRLVMADTKVIDIETGYWLVGPDGQETRPALPIVPPLGDRGSEGILCAKRLTLTLDLFVRVGARMSGFHPCNETIHLSPGR